ncbi:MAG: hypothetical protein AAB316_03395 [Bacteroidota bacterium]
MKKLTASAGLQPALAGIFDEDRPFCKKSCRLSETTCKRRLQTGGSSELIFNDLVQNMD